MTSFRSRKGKEPAAESSGGPVVGNPGNGPIEIVEQGCTLIIEGSSIPGTPLFRARCEGSRCIALRKTLNDAYNMHNTLNKCQHPNLLESIGVWPDPSDKSKAYIVVNHLDNALSSLEKEQLFHVERGYLCGFSELGFKAFREIFSAIHYINSCYEGRATSSARNNKIQLFPVMLEPNNIFFQMVNGEARIMVGNFKMELSDEYMRKDQRNRPLVTRREDIEAAHWNEVGRCLKTLYGTHQVSTELRELADFLIQGAVTYYDLLWQPGIWDAPTKMQFIREIFRYLDVERKDKDNDSFACTPRGRMLMRKSSLVLLGIMNQFSPPVDRNDQELKIKDDHLLDSVLFLRNKIVAHYDEEYPKFKGDKNEIGTTEETVEWYIRKRKPEYILKLAKTIRGLGWISESPVMRGATDYMTAFSKMKI
ncbi:uncharacterized protein LOC133923788 [Phragmites australis]|uniref:uncharacterized protein LOC133923788 n=1 Tax=Phragmites australis TaxID=29695 RepID=UPI002D7695EC|nr:uncharacterized protein LOC133923788 [Phragmites australis]